MKLRFAQFKTEDFPEYESWYQDAELNKHLGPMDQEWLDAVMNQTDGCQYSVFSGAEIVAVVSIKFPVAAYPFYFVTDLAIKPHLRHQGIGSQVLAKLTTLHLLQPGQSWKACVHKENPKAMSFLRKNGWVCVSEPSEHGMIDFEFSPTD